MELSFQFQHFLLKWFYIFGSLATIYIRISKYSWKLNKILRDSGVANAKFPSSPIGQSSRFQNQKEVWDVLLNLKRLWRFCPSLNATSALGGPLASGGSSERFFSLSGGRVPLLNERHLANSALKLVAENRTVDVASVQYFCEFSSQEWRRASRRLKCHNKK